MNDNLYISTKSNKSFENKTFYKFKIILIGDVGVGKTSLLERYMDEQFIETRPCTIQADSKIKSIKIDNLTSATLTIWDTCGQERFRGMTKLFFKNAQGIILLFDVNNRNSFSNLNMWLEDINKNTNKVEVSIVLCGNKIDLNREISFEEANNFANNNDLIYCEASCKDGINVESPFEKCTFDIVDRINRKHKFESEISKPISLNPSIRAIKGKERLNENKSICC